MNNESNRKYQKEYYKKNREKKLKEGKEHYQKNKEKRLAYCKEYYKKNREWLNCYHKEWAKRTGYIQFMHSSERIERIDKEISERLENPTRLNNQKILKSLKKRREEEFFKLIPYIEKTEGSSGNNKG